MTGAFGDQVLTSLPKMGIGEYAELLEDIVLRASAVRDGRLVLLPVTLSMAEYDGMAAHAIFDRRLERHKREIAALLDERERRR